MTCTKDKILDTALTLFSQRGYNGTSMSELAEAVGITKPALYKHYESKEEIRNCLLDRVEKYYDESFDSKIQLPGAPKSADEFISLSMRLVKFTIHDETIIKVRKMLTLEQFQDTRSAELATRHFITHIENTFSGLFSEMAENRQIKNDDFSLLAFEFTAPITTLIHMCDHQPQKEAEITEKIRKHIVWFYREIFE